MWQQFDLDFGGGVRCVTVFVGSQCWWLLGLKQKESVLSSGVCSSRKRMEVLGELKV